MAFVGKLLDFQKEMALFMLNKKRCINASGTGLGKTIETIAAAEKLFKEGLADKCIIISLATLKEQWCNRLDEFSTNHFVMVDGTPKKREAQWKAALKHRVKYVVLNYETLVEYARAKKTAQGHGRIAPLWDILEKFKHERCIIACDEGTKIKNWRSKTSQRIKTLYARWMWLLTATPIENTPDELFSLMEWIRRGALGSYGAFKRDYMVENYFGGVSGYKNLHKLHDVVKPYLLRHTREMVKGQLPELVFKDMMCDLGDAQKVYQFVRDDLLSLLEGMGTDVDLSKFDPDCDEDSEMTQVLQRYTALRQICQSPQILKYSRSPYAQYLVENGIIKNQMGDKLDETVDTIKGILNEEQGNKVVVFNFFKGFIGLLHERLKGLKRAPHILRYTGDENKAARKEAQHLFNSDPRKRIILCSDAGGYGLDLPGGTHVLNTDLPWHPGKLDQRIRTERISSRHSSNTILTLTVRNTIEARMYDGERRKRKLAEAVVEGKHRKDKELTGGEFKLNKETLYKYLTGE